MRIIHLSVELSTCACRPGRGGIYSSPHRELCRAIQSAKFKLSFCTCVSIVFKNTDTGGIKLANQEIQKMAIQIRCGCELVREPQQILLLKAPIMVRPVHISLHSINSVRYTNSTGHRAIGIYIIRRHTGANCCLSCMIQAL